MSVVMKSKPVVEAMSEDLRRRIDVLKARGCEPALAIVRVGERPDDLSYERTAKKRAEALGIAVRVCALDAFVSDADLLDQIALINQDPDVHGCLLFRPLPEFMEEKAICDALSIEKDIDGISTAALGAVFTDSEDAFAPCTAEACVEILDHYGVELAGKHVVVVGRSLVIGKPVSMLLLKRNASVTICHSRTADLPAHTRAADIVVCATGRPRAFGAEYFRPGQTVLDVGISFDADGKLCGDVDFEAVEPIVDALTPVPGGIGSVTTSVTMAHVVAAAERAAGIGSAAPGTNDAAGARATRA